jgi:hypothetical protein
MLRRFGFGVLWAIPAYLFGAFGGGYLVSMLSSNPHDRSVEAAMTGAFVVGPLAGLIGFVIGAARTVPRPSTDDVAE